VRTTLAGQANGAIGRPQRGVGVAPRDHEDALSLPLQCSYGRRQPVASGDNPVRPELLGDTTMRAPPSPGDNEKKLAAMYSSCEDFSQRVDLNLDFGQSHDRPIVGDADHRAMPTEYPRSGRHPPGHLHRLGAQSRQWPDHPAAAAGDPVRLLWIKQTGNLCLNQSQFCRVVVQYFHGSNDGPTGHDDCGIEDNGVHAVKPAQDGAVHHDDVTAGQFAAQMGRESLSSEARGLWQTGHEGAGGTPRTPRGTEGDAEGAQRGERGTVRIALDGTARQRHRPCLVRHRFEQWFAALRTQFRFTPGERGPARP
jgi:hypothetical protein